MTKTEALGKVREAVIHLADVQGTTLDAFRQANADLAWAQLHAASAGARAWEINAASEWEGQYL